MIKSKSTQSLIDDKIKADCREPWIKKMKAKNKKPIVLEVPEDLIKKTGHFPDMRDLEHKDYPKP